MALQPHADSADQPKEIHLQDLHTFTLKPMNAPSRGPANAKVTVVEFTDYTCRFCHQMEPTVRKVMEDNKDSVHFVMAHHWLSAHKNARLAAQVAMAANLQGKFWPVHDMLFDKHFAGGSQGATIEGYLPYLKTIPGLDLDKLQRDVNSPEVNAELDAEVKALASDSTPEIVINGHMHLGQLTEAQFNQLIKEACAAAARPYPACS